MYEFDMIKNKNKKHVMLHYRYALNCKYLIQFVSIITFNI